MIRPATHPSAPTEPETTFEATERRRQAALFTQITQWLVVLSALVAAAYLVAYLVAPDPRILPIWSVCAGFSAGAALIRARVKNVTCAVYLVSASIAAGMVGVAASVSSISALIVIATMLLPTLFTGLLLTPRHMLRTALFSVAAALVSAQIDDAAMWSRIDLSTIPAVRWIVHATVGSTILFLLMALFRNLDRANREARESARQLRLLYETSRLFSTAMAPDDLLSAVAKNLASILDATGCLIVLCDPASGEPRPEAVYGTHRDMYRRLHLGPDEPSLTRAVVRRRAPIVVEDVRSSPYISPRVAAVSPARSLVSLPLIHRDEVLGVVVIGESRHQRRFTPTEIEHAQGLVQQVSAEIANAQSLERERRQAAELAVLNRVSMAVAASLHPVEVCQRIANEVSQAAGYEHVTLYVLEGQTLRLQAVVGHEAMIREMPIERGLIGKVARTGQPVLVPDVRRNADYVAALPDVTGEACVPIRLGDEILGVINVETCGPRPLDPNDLSLLVSIAAQIAVALRNAQLFEQTRRHLDELSFLYEMARETAATFDGSQVMRLAADGLARSLGVQACAFSYWDRAGNSVITIGKYALDGDQVVMTPPRNPVYHLDEYPATRAVLETQSIKQLWAGGLDVLPEEARLLREMDFASVLLLPLATHAGAFGLLELFRKDAREFSAGEIARGMAAANLTTLALERARLFESERRSRQVTETLLDVAHALSSTLDLDALLKLILDQLRSLVPYVSASIALLDDEGRHYTMRASRGLPEALLGEPPTFDVETTPTTLALSTVRRPYRIADTHTDPNWRHLRDSEHIRAWLGLPLLRDEHVIGFLMLDHTRPGFFTEEHERLAGAFTLHAAIAIENARLLDQTRKQAERERLVRDISSKISASIQIDTVMQTAVEELGRALDVSRCLIRLGVDPEQMPVAYEFHRPDTLPLGVGNPEHTPMLTVAVRERRTAVDHESHLRLAGAPLLAGLVTPIFIRGQIAGTLALHQCDRRRHWTPGEIALVEDVSAHLGLAIDNARLYQEVTHSLSDLNLLHSISTAVTSAASLPEAANRVVESVRSAMQHAHVTLLLVDPDTADLVIGAAVGYGSNISSVRIKAGQGITGWVAQTGRPMLAPDVRCEPRYIDGSGDGSIRAELAVPLIAHSEVVGVLNLESPHTGAFDEADLHLLTTLGGNLAMIIRNLRLLDEVRAANARLQELDRLKSQFMASMSHELRTPLNSIIGFSEVLLDGLVGVFDNGDQREFVANIHTSGKHLLALINDVLDLSKIQAGKMVLDRQAVQPAGVVDEVCGVIAPLVAKKSQTLALEVEPDLPALLADSFRLKQILINLLSNAHKFSPAGSRIMLAARSDDGFVRFSVVDAGDGIKPEDQERVFQEFVQVDSGMARTQEGTGLGLPITRRLVELHGGRIWIESEGVPGRGAAFYFTIPVVTPIEEPMPMSATPADGPEGAEERRPVLIVEDDRQLSSLLALYFSQEGYRPIPHYSGESVAARARELRPALITLDLMMPERDGWSALRDLKSAPDTCDVPVIIISALDHPDSGLRQDTVEYLAKPLDREALLAALQRITSAAGRSASRHREAGAPCRVLIVDDDPFVDELLKAMLPQPEYDVTHVLNGSDALEAIRHTPPDLIILDLLIPGLHGMELLELLRADPATRDLPVIVLTAKTLNAEERARLNGTAQTLITKSDFTRRQLVDALRRLRLPAQVEAVALDVAA